MRTITRDDRGDAPPEPVAARAPGVPARRIAATLAGPALIVASVLVALRGFAFADLLSNQHPDLLSFWLPRSCFLGRSLSAGHVPLWNPFEMAGTPFAADPQSGWLSTSTMLTSWLFGCGDGLRALIVLQPLLAGLGLFWFLRREELGRVAATMGGLSLAMAIAASNVAISLPFAGTLAWTPFVLVGASGYLRTERWSARVPWAALAAFAWGQVAGAHMSHGLVMCSGLAFAYLLATSIRQVREGRRSAGMAAALTAGFLVLLPLANVAILWPRLALIARSSLRGGYASLGGTLARAAGVEDRPLPTNGVWSAWPLGIGASPGAYAGAAILLLVPAALRSRRHRALTLGLLAAGIVGYVLTLNLLVSAGWFRALILRLPFGDVYLHNPGRLRYLEPIVVPVLGAVGLQGFLDRLPAPREAWWWLGASAALFLGLPLALGADPFRFVILAVGMGAAIPVLRWLRRGRRWAVLALPAVLAAELLGDALWASAYQGGTVYVGLQSGEHPNLPAQPLRWPDVRLTRYLEPGTLARALLRQGVDDGRYLAWIPPAAYFNKGYLFSQDPQDWPALLLGRALLFGLEDTLGYSPIQLPRYWSYIRATNRYPVFYNASVLQLPEMADVRLFGIRYLVIPKGIVPTYPIRGAPTVPGRVVASERGYDLYEVQGWQPRVSVVPHWTAVASGVEALRAVQEPGFNPAIQAVVEQNPGIPAAPVAAPAGRATYHETHPEDVRVSVHAEAPSLVVIRNAWDRGWSATVDGRPAPVLRADYFLQAVPVPAGDHEIRLAYTDPTIGRGLAASAAVWGVLVAALVGALIAERRARRRGHEPDKPELGGAGEA
ncbi:MAG: YfhO family protein [Candidatus Velamenicoccus archaeovorus]